MNIYINYIYIYIDRCIFINLLDCLTSFFTVINCCILYLKIFSLLENSPLMTNLAVLSDIEVPTGLRSETLWFVCRWFPRECVCVRWVGRKRGLSRRSWAQMQLPQRSERTPQGLELRWPFGAVLLNGAASKEGP